MSLIEEILLKIDSHKEEQYCATLNTLNEGSYDETLPVGNLFDYEITFFEEYVYEKQAPDSAIPDLNSAIGHGKNMLSKIEIIKTLFNLFPPFEKYRENEITNLWGEDLGIHMDMSSFSHYIIDLIASDSKKNSQKEIELTFIFIEQLMNEGSEEVQEAAATCFLENLVNAVSWETIPASSFVNLLGSESKKYCEAWDAFTGDL